MKLNTLQIYYLLSPLFFILHYFFDINLRLSIPGASEHWFFIYYLVCFVASFFVFKNAIAGALFSLFESALNILLLLLSVMLPVFTLASAAVDNVAFKFGVPELLHFFIVGFVLVKSFYVNPLFARRS